MENNSQLEELAKEVRKDIFNMLVGCGGGHFGGAFSCVEILTAMYFQLLKKNDKFILSKAHASVSLYSVLSKKGIIEKEILGSYGKKGSPLGIHAERHLVPGIELSCGSLGHGLSYGVGVALAQKMKSENNRVFVLIGDGESEEGSIWEAAMFASQHKLYNLVAIVDYNKIQSMGRIKEILDLEPLSDKWKSFGWNVSEVDGHNINALINLLEKISISKKKPNVILAHTIKGKGLSFLEDNPSCHYYSLNEKELIIANKELK